MILKTVQVSGKSLRCDVCGYEWVSIAAELPECCPDRKCRSRKWNGSKKRGRTPKIVLPKPTISRWTEEDNDF